MRTQTFKTVFVAVSGLALAACASDGASHIPESYLHGSSLDRYDLTAQATTEMIEINLQPGDSQLRRDEINKLKAFLATYTTNGDGPLMLSIPTGQINEQLVISAAAEIRDISWQAGVEYEQIDGSAYISGDDLDAPILVAFRRYLVVQPDCPTWATVDMTDGVSNNDAPTLGCSVRTNMAAMIAHPADLLGERALDGSDSTRRQFQFERWRGGEQTGANRSEDESGAVSAAVN